MGAIGSLLIDDVAPDWLIIGGESGVRADRLRPTNPLWVRAAIAECHQVGASPFLKQWGSYINNPLVFEGGLLSPRPHLSIRQATAKVVQF